MLSKRSDNEIKSDVLSELRWDSRTSESPIEVNVSDGVVTLTGAVPNYAKKAAAQDAAHHVAGVLDVANDIQLKPFGVNSRSDTQIANAVRRMLEWDAFVPNERVTSTVSDGWVTLEGAVENSREREDAEHAISRLNGVVGVINKIAIQKRPLDPKKLREQIEHALERRADRETERLRVEVRDSEVDLHGRVHSWQERRAVLGSISHAPGVTRVIDHLRIDPHF